MTKTYSVFLRINANGDQGDDHNVLAQHHRTYAGIVRASDRITAFSNAEKKSGQPCTGIVLIEGQVFCGEDEARCPLCGADLSDVIEVIRGRLKLYGDAVCSNCDGRFTGQVKTVTRVILYGAPDA